jgi:GNAT superfamily N-acetyltransferase
MATAPAQRGRGIASALLARLLTWAWEHGAAHAYLQVDAANAPALAVYGKFGFATVYTYHYCGRPGERE